MGYSDTGYICGTGFVFTFMAQSSRSVAIAMAAATGAIGVAGMICGTVLASQEPGAAAATSYPPAQRPYDTEAV